MTKRERAQVVDLLRCAADGLTRLWYSPGWAAADFIGADLSVVALANKAVDAIDPAVFVERDDFRTIALETAMRVEEGTWPL